MANTKWVVDPAHSEFKFKVKHLMITNVTGYFRKFNIEVETDDEDFTKASKILLQLILIPLIPIMNNAIRI